MPPAQADLYCSKFFFKPFQTGLNASAADTCKSQVRSRYKSSDFIVCFFFLFHHGLPKRYLPIAADGCASIVPKAMMVVAWNSPLFP